MIEDIEVLEVKRKKTARRLGEAYRECVYIEDMIDRLNSLMRKKYKTKLFRWDLYNVKYVFLVFIILKSKRSLIDGNYFDSADICDKMGKQGCRNANEIIRKMARMGFIKLNYAMKSRRRTIHFTQFFLDFIEGKK